MSMKLGVGDNFEDSCEVLDFWRISEQKNLGIYFGAIVPKAA